MFAFVGAPAPSAPLWFAFDPGVARLECQEGSVRLQNAAISFEWKLGGNPAISSPKLGLKPGRGSEAFVIELQGGRELLASELRLRSGPNPVALAGGRRAQAEFEDPASGLEVTWSVKLLDGANFLVQRLELKSPKSLFVDKIEPVVVRRAGEVSGSCLGSPLSGENWFAGVMHPISYAEYREGVGTAWIQRKLPLEPGTSVAVESIFGVAPKGQVRRSLLRALEMLRPRKYQPFLHYNSWYDIGYFTPYTQKECLERIDEFGHELTEKRGVKIDSFLFDDGWDDTSKVWEFHSGFPEGFRPLRDAAAKWDAAPGMWLSPWGGYGGPRDKRLATGRRLGYEVDSQGYALSGPKYFERFREVCLDMVRNQGVNQFKFDGTGSPDKQAPGSRFASDFDAAIALIGELREAKPDLFVNLTTGTWPSPFWLLIADSIWRGGSDHGFEGVGSSRQKWITYRDAATYSGVTTTGPLYPLNSLMVHGILFAKNAHGLDTDPHGDFPDEVHTYFGSGTQLQELYITPALLTERNWDQLAEAAKWSRENAEVLVDTHWVGGNPRELEVYGWASWSPTKAILTLRNPSDARQAFSIEPQRVFELPEGMWKTVAFDAKWRSTAPERLDLARDESRVVVLDPFEVVTYEAAQGR